MGKMAIGLNRLFDRAVRQKIFKNDETMPSVEQLVKKGYDPLHAIYLNTVNLISLFGEQASTLPPLHKINDFIGEWQDTYQPGLPPMSPIANTFFTCWTLFDVTFGVEKETVGTCFLSLLHRLPLDPAQVDAARNLNQSRMGLYEVLGGKEKFYSLRELVTDKRFTVYICSGYQGKSGDIIFIRLLPPLENSQDYYIGLTTPYQMIMQSNDDWLRYFERHDIRPGTVGAETRLYRHLKYGKSRTYWSEYLFYGYANFGPGVIKITGFPDQPETQPAHDNYRS